MSIRHVAAVLDHYPHGDARKLVLMAIAENVNEGSWVGCPSQARIAARACISIKTLQRIVPKLESEHGGLIEVVKRRGRKQTNFYRLRLDRLLALPSLVDIEEPIKDVMQAFEPITFTASDMTSEKATDCRVIHTEGAQTGSGGPVVRSETSAEKRRQIVALSPVDKSPGAAPKKATSCPEKATQLCPENATPMGVAQTFNTFIENLSDSDRCASVDNHAEAVFGNLVGSLSDRWQSPPGTTTTAVIEQVPPHAVVRHRYVDKTGRILSAGKGLGESFMTFRDGHRVKSPALPVRDSLAEAQQDLDVYATVKDLREYR